MVGGASLFDGSILASYGKVIVALINFRLSILGFLSDMTAKVLHFSIFLVFDFLCCILKYL
jgi:carboxylesterase type B